MAPSLAYMQAWIIARLGITSDGGAALVEYAVLLAFIAIVCITAVTLLGRQTSSHFSRAASGLQ